MKKENIRDRSNTLDCENSKSIFCDKLEPEVSKELMKSEMKIERQLNFFRVSFFLLIILLDFASYALIDSEIEDYMKESYNALVYVLIAGGIYLYLKKVKYSGWMKFATVSIDMFGVCHLGLVFIKHGFPFPLSLVEMLMYISMVIIIFNSLSAIRYNRKVVIYSAALAVVGNLIVFAKAGLILMTGVYTSMFILFLSIFNLWVSKKIRNSVVSNIQLEFTFNEISDANKQISSQRDEIQAQMDEIEAQRDEIEAQRDQIEAQHDKLAVHKKEMEDSITYSYRIQKAILPPDYFVKELLPTSFIYYKPKDIVSGDFYFVERVSTKIIFSVVDCTGHGVPGAMMSVIGYNLLKQAVKIKGITDPGQILSFLDKGVTETLRQYKNESGVKDGMDLTVCSLDTERNLLQVAAAYNPLYIARNGEIHKLKADRFPIGSNFDGKCDEYANYEIMLEKGDTLYLTTDGFPDQFGGPENKKYKLGPMKQFFQSICSESKDEQLALIDKEFNTWKGDTYQVDDVCIMGVLIE